MGQAANEPKQALSSQAPTITVVSPNGGETWTMGEEVDIEWTSQDVPGDMRIDLYRGNGVLVDKLWRTGSSNGSISWTVRSDLDPGSDYYIQIGSFDNPDVVDTSDENFTVQSGTGPQITLTYPSGGEELPIGGEVEIEWTSQNIGGDVDIRLYEGYAENGRTIAINTANDGSHTWRVPSDLAPGDEYYIFIISRENRSVWGDSDFFEINYADSGTLSLTVTAKPDPVQPGEMVTYRFTVTNAGATDLLDVSVWTIVPEHVESFLGAGVGGFCHNIRNNCFGGVTLSWDLGTLPAGQSRTVMMTPVLRTGSDAPPEGSFEVEGYAQAEDEPIVSGSQSVRVDTSPQLTLGMSPNVSTGTPGETLTYTVTFGNRSGVDVSSARMQALIPEGTSFISASDEGTYSNGNIDWNLGTIGDSQAGQRQFTVKINSGAADGDLIQGQVEVTSASDAQARAQAATVVQVDPALRLSMTAEPDPIAPNELITYTLTATNQGAEDLTNAWIRAVVPDYVESFLGVTAGGSCTNIRNNCFTGLHIVWELDAIPAGEEWEVQFITDIRSGSSAPPDGALIHGSGSTGADGVNWAIASTNTVVDSSPAQPDIVLLTREASDGTLETYDPNQHAWGFSNSALIGDEPIMWPYSWYSEEFDYTSDDYPPALDDFYGADPEDFPGWDRYCEAFGEEVCYWSTANSLILKPLAALHWARIKGDWDGSCFGFAISSYLFFDRFLDLEAEFPDASDLSTVQVNDNSENGDARALINKLWVFQFGSGQQDQIDANRAKTPNETLSDIRAMFESETRNDQILVFYNTSGLGGHAVNPFRIEESANAAEIFVYDNNYPGAEKKIVVDKTANSGSGSWSYASLGWSGNDELFLMDPISNYTSTAKGGSYQVPPRDRFIASQAISADHVQLFSSLGSIRIENSSGEMIKYDADGLSSTLTDGSPIIPFVAKETRPPGYYLPTDQYSVALSGAPDTTLSFSAFTGDKAFDLRRNEASSDQSDYIFFDSAAEVLSVANRASSSKTYDATIILSGADEDRRFILERMGMAEGDSVSLEPKNGENLWVRNEGESKSYNLTVERRSAEGLLLARYTGLNLDSNEAQELIPGWSDLEHEPLAIAVDSDLDGTPDDTTEVMPNEVLPVEFVSFEGVASQGEVNLRWKTISEYNNAGFEVQRRVGLDGHFESVGYVQGAGTTAEVTTYRFTDGDLPFGTRRVTYRLKQVDFDGTFEYSKEVEVQLNVPTRLALHGNYPNPFADRTTIRYEVPTAGEVRLDVYNMLGQLVATLVEGRQRAGRKEIIFNGGNLASGVYVIRLQAGREVLTQKISIVR